MKSKFLLAILLCWPLVSMAENTEMSATVEQYKSDVGSISTEGVSDNTINETKAEMEKHIADAQKAECDPNAKDNTAGETKTGDNRTDEEKQKALEDAQKKYDEAKENEQSTANKTLTALTTAATGIGGMELAQGLAEQTADKNASMDMEAYIATFRCTYGDGKSVKGGPAEVELPGGNDQNMMNLRAQYIALVNDLKERKAALDLTPGIESEEILDKSEMGLYDDENVGVTGGAYESLYRAKMLNSEEDQTKIDANKKTSKNRVMGGAIAAGAGAVIGIAGNVILNNEEVKAKIKELKEKRDEKKESEALEKLKACLKEGGAKDTESLSFSNFKASSLSLNKIDCSGNKWKKLVGGQTAQNLFEDTNEESAIEKIKSSFSIGEDTSIAEMLLK